jgi:hypothetical protein
MGRRSLDNDCSEEFGSSNAQYALWLAIWLIRDYWTGVALIFWCLWRHRNDVVFEGATASPHTVIRNIRREAELWKAAGLFKADLAVVDRWRIGE